MNWTLQGSVKWLGKVWTAGTATRLAAPTRSNTRVGSLRKTYGEHFAKDRRKDMMLKTCLVETGTDSLHAYLRKHDK